MSFLTEPSKWIRHGLYTTIFIGHMYLIVLIFSWLNVFKYSANNPVVIMSYPSLVQLFAVLFISWGLFWTKDPSTQSLTLVLYLIFNGVFLITLIVCAIITSRSSHTQWKQNPLNQLFSLSYGSVAFLMEILVWYVIKKKKPLVSLDVADIVDQVGEVVVKISPKKAGKASPPPRPPPPILLSPVPDLIPKTYPSKKEKGKAPSPPVPIPEVDFDEETDDGEEFSNWVDEPPTDPPQRQQMVKTSPPPTPPPPPPPPPMAPSKEMPKWVADWKAAAATSSPGKPFF